MSKRGLYASLLAIAAIGAGGRSSAEETTVFVDPVGPRAPTGPKPERRPKSARRLRNRKVRGWR